MKIRSRVFWFSVLALFALLWVAGCDQPNSSPFTAEVDEQGYRRAKDLLRQGRNQEALTEFQHVIEKRGLNNAPESHLELGLLYQNHIHDPIAAIYHYRRYLELKPNIHPQDELVRQRIDAATREFARTLPAQPLDNMERFDMTDVVQRLQRENEQLKSELARARSLAGNRTRAEANSISPDENMTESNGPAQLPGSSPVSGSAADNSNTESAPALLPPQRNPISPATASNEAPVPTAAPARPAPAAPRASAAAGRRHTIAKGDTLYSLAQHYYGNRSRWRDIFEANRDILKSKDEPLRIGMELKIP